MGHQSLCNTESSNSSVTFKSYLAIPLQSVPNNFTDVGLLQGCFMFLLPFVLTLARKCILEMDWNHILLHPGKTAVSPLSLTCWPGAGTVISSSRCFLRIYGPLHHRLHNQLSASGFMSIILILPTKWSVLSPVNTQLFLLLTFLRNNFLALATAIVNSH